MTSLGYSPTDKQLEDMMAKVHTAGRGSKIIALWSLASRSLRFDRNHISSDPPLRSVRCTEALGRSPIGFAVAPSDSG